ncbi:MAG: hypothetical protein IJX81_02425 [Clostridia bacterium]|nr:hypothetical protein [Clostridia bacterium]
MLDIYRVSFIGHRDIYQYREIENELEKVIYDLLYSKEYVEFYVGRNGDFDIMVASVIKRVQKDFGNHNSTLILVLPYPVKDMEYYEKYYDEIILPVSSKTHYKAAITERNKWFIDNTDLLIAYVIKDKGGAAQCLNMAIKQNRKILRLCNSEET